MRGLITYSSKTGNTKALAETIAKTLEKDHDITLLPVEEAKDEKVDFYLHGFWVNRSRMDPASKTYLKNLPKGARLGLFGTSGGEHTVKGENARLVKDVEEAQAPFESLGLHYTIGKVDPALLSKLDGILGVLVPKKTKELIKEMSAKSREATDKERQAVADAFLEELK